MTVALSRAALAIPPQTFYDSLRRAHAFIESVLASSLVLFIPECCIYPEGA